MKLLGVIRFELAYQARRAWPWVILAVLVGLSFLVARDNSLADALYEDFFANSPFAIAKTTVFGSLLWLMVAAVIAGEAAARDVATGMHPLVYTTTITKAEYLGGRFLAALALNFLLLLGVQAAILLAVYLPGVDPRVIGPFRPAAFFTAYTFIAVPNAVAATAIQFAAAARTGRPMTGYLGSFLLFFMAYFIAGLLLWNRELGILLDPIGVRFIWDELSHLWTTVEKSTRMLELEGGLLANRLLWLSVAVAALAFTYGSFQFGHRTVGSWMPWRRRRVAHAPVPARLGVEASAPIPVPQVARTFGLAIHVQKTLAIAWESFRATAKSWAGLAMLLGIPLLTVVVVADQMVSLGTPLTPTTARVIAELTGPLANAMSRWMVVPVLIIYFAGELIWREREAGLAEISDATPGPEWAPFLGKFLGLGILLAAFTALQMTAGMVAQVMWDYRNFETGLYLKTLFGLQLPDYLLFAVLALTIHVLVNQKYIAHLVAIIVYVFIAALASMVGIEHKLLVYGASPGWLLSPQLNNRPSTGTGRILASQAT
jgi:ABC-type transport system involved in multi-copper enzyme maturation permease subunit